MSSGAGKAADARGATITRNTALALAVQLSGAAFTAIIIVFLARRLGSVGYGVYSLALGIAGLVLLPSDFGVSNSVARFVAEHRDDHPRVEAVLADGLRLKFIASLLVAVLLGVLAQPIASAYGIPALIWPIRAVAIAVFAQSIMMIGSVFVATGQIGLQLRTAIIESAVELTASVGLVLAGAGATGAVFGHAIGYVIGAVATIVLLSRLLGRGILPRSVRFGADARRVAGYAGILLIVDGAYTAFSQIDVLIIGAYAGASAAGFFSAPMRLTAFLAYPGSAVSSGVAPRLARRSGGEPNITAFVAGLRLLLVVQAAVTSFVVGWAGLMIKISLGGGFAQSAPLLRGLAPYVFLSGFGPLVSISANYLGEASKRVPVALATVAINVVLDLILVPRIGAMGGVIGTDVAYALYAPAHLVICQRALHIDLRPTLRTFLRTTLAALLMTDVLLLFGDSIDHIARTVLGAVAAVVVFCLVLLLTNEVSFSEARDLIDRLPLADRLERRLGNQSRS